MKNSFLSGPIVSAQWLAENIGNPKIIILEVVLSQKEISESKIPNSSVFNVDLLSDPDSHLPHMMPSTDLFGEGVRQLGVNQDSIVVVYDSKGIYSSPRAWFMFRAMGFNNVAVLDGGLPAWKEKGFSTSNVAVKTQVGNFQPVNVNEIFCDANEVDTAKDKQEFTIVDARSAARFNAEEPEPRPGLRMGRIPNSVNVPFTEVLSGIYFKTPEKLLQIFEKSLAGRKKLIMSCGSGVTACIVGLAGYIAGYRDVAIYDGSWTDWGQDERRTVHK